MKNNVGLQEWVNFDWLLLCIVLTTIVFGPMAFYFFFVLLCVISFTNKYYCIPLLFFSGSVKAIPLVAAFPVDFTLLSIIYFLVCSALNLIEPLKINRDKLWLCGLLVLLLIIASLSILFTPASFFYLQRSGFFLLLNIFIAIILLLFWPLHNPDRMLTAFTNFSIFIGLIWVGLGVHNQMYNKVILDLKYPHDKMWHISSFGEDYMVFSIFTIMTLLAVGLIFFYRKKTTIKAFLMIFLLYGLLASPARGLTIGFLLSFFLLFFYSFNGKIKISTIFTASVIAVITSLLIFIFRQQLSVTLNRLTYYDTAGKSIGDRLDFIAVAIERWTDKFIFGTGIDSVIYYNGAMGTHVHNVFLETVIEFGIIGGLPFLLFFSLTLIFFHYLFRKASQMKNIQIIWIAMVFFIFFIFGMFSGSLSQIRSLWMLICIIIIIYIDHVRPQMQEIPSHHSLNENNSRSGKSADI